MVMVMVELKIEFRKSRECVLDYSWTSKATIKGQSTYQVLHFLLFCPKLNFDTFNSNAKQLPCIMEQ